MALKGRVGGAAIAIVWMRGTELVATKVESNRRRKSEIAAKAPGLFRRSEANKM